MKVVKQWNAISEKLKATIPSFERGEFKNFQMLNGKKNDDFDEMERRKKPMLFPRTQIPTRDRIFDPYLNGGKGGYVDIIVADGWNNDEPTRSKFFLPGEGDYEFGGRFGLSGSSLGDQEMFEYLWICNHREGNPNRDETIPALFKFIDVKEDSDKLGSTEDEIFEAGQMVRSMEEAEIRRIAAAMNWPNDSDFTIINNKMKEYARTNSKQFLELANSNTGVLDAKATIKQALDEGVLTFDGTSGELKNKKNLLARFTAGEGFDLLEEVAAWQASAANGKDVMQSIKSQLKKK